MHLDRRTKVATLESSDDQPHGALASSQGNAQPLNDGFGGYVVGWGNLNYFSAFDGHGNLTFDASFPAGVNTYRVYLLPWNPGSSGGKSHSSGGHRGWGDRRGQHGPTGHGRATAQHHHRS